MLLTVTGDENYVNNRDPETKQQSSQWKREGVTSGKECNHVHAGGVFVYIYGVVHFECVPQGQTVTAEYYGVNNLNCGMMAAALSKTSVAGKCKLCGEIVSAQAPVVKKQTNCN